MEGVKTSKAALARIVVLMLIVVWATLVAVRRRAVRPPDVGDSAPDFVLPALGGGSVALHDRRQGIVVVNFWATWCPPCIEETPSLERFAAQMQGTGVSVISVSVDEDESALAKFVADNHLSFPVARDPKRAVASRYGTFKFPESYILDPEGKVAEKIVGAIDWQDPRLIEYARDLARRVHPAP